MDEKIRHKIKIKKIREMKTPIILINENDYDIFKTSVDSKITVVVGYNPTYQGVPIKTSQLIEKGNIVVFDDIYYNWL